MMMARNRMMALVLACLSWAGTASGGTVDVRVVGEDNHPMAYEALLLRAISVDTDHRTSYDLRIRGKRAIADIDGRASFKGLPPGTYVVQVPRPRDPAFLPPRANPLAPRPEVSIFEKSDRVELDLQLVRGILISLFLDLPHDEVGGFAGLFRHRESGRVLTSTFRRGQPSVERLLVPGVWEIEVQAKPGYLLVGLDRDREPLPGHIVHLDLVHEPPPSHLTWTYTAAATLTGSVVEASGKQPAVSLVAKLLTPGSWYEAAMRRGGSTFDEVAAGVDPNTGTYEMHLPDGEWEVRPISPLLLESQPESVIRLLAPGGVGRADFTVRLDNQAPQGMLIVQVDSAERPSLRDAAVEIYSAADTSTPIRADVTARDGEVRVPQLDKGNYIVVAGHEEYLEARVNLQDYDPRKQGSKMVFMTLPKGALVRFSAKDPEGAPLPEVELSLERVGGAPETLLKAPEFVQAKARRNAVSDRSGRVRVKGLYPGTYRARARLVGRHGARGLLLVNQRGQRPQRKARFRITSRDEVIDLEASMLPAASLRASLVCNDAWPLPTTASVRVFQAQSPDPTAALAVGPPASEPPTGLVVAAADIPLEGKSRDTLTVGPLEGGSYRFAVRPTGFDRWTWAFETHRYALSSEVQVTTAEKSAGGVVDLGLLQIECGPAVDLMPVVATGESFPPLHTTKASVRVLDLEEAREIAKPPAIRGADDRLELRGLPRGAQRLEITLSHPHLLPEPSLTWLIEMELERGSHREISPEIERLGGSIRITGHSGRVILQNDDGLRREAFAEDAPIEIPSLMPGRYRVELRDASEAPSRIWKDLEVEAGKTLQISARQPAS